MIWNCDNFYGGVYDFDGDGQTDAMEEALGYQILDEMSRGDNDDRDDDDDI